MHNDYIPSIAPSNFNEAEDAGTEYYLTYIYEQQAWCTLYLTATKEVYRYTCTRHTTAALICANKGFKSRQLQRQIFSRSNVSWLHYVASI